ncbi:hypothetical protein EA145_19350 [Enterobacter hormaechei]|nr:hypothetical protein C7B73_02060 [Enterobacter hormaechei]RLZ30743.1 hypothetical protein EA145_19350 [Enterobacter hormaechei]
MLETVRFILEVTQTVIFGSKLTTEQRKALSTQVQIKLFIIVLWADFTFLNRRFKQTVVFRFQITTLLTLLKLVQTHET